MPVFAGLTRSEWLCLAVFAAVGFVNMSFHELWRDEFQAFIIARESVSIPDLLGKMRYEGHPPLWGLWLYFLTRFSVNPFYMQLSHLLIACISAYVILRFPVPRRQKFLLVFGYFSIFEFLTIVRNYAMGFLLINTSILLIMSARPKKYLMLTPLLFLLCLTSIYGVIIAVSIGVYLILDIREAKREGASFPWRELMPGGFAILAGMALFVVSIIPPADRIADIPVGLNLEYYMRRFASVMTGIWRSYVPIPSFQVEFWSDNIISNKIIRFFLSVVLLAFSIKLFFRAKKVFILYCFGTFSILAFSYFVYNSPNLRHFGHLYIIFMMCLVLASRAESISSKTARYFVPLILTFQVVAGVSASMLDWVYPFTAGKAAANYIKDQGLDDHVIIGDEDYVLTTLSGYLEKPVYHLSILRPATYVTWNKERLRTVEPREVVETANALEMQGHNVLVALNYELEPWEAGNLEKISEFTESVTKDEVFHFYKINPARDLKTAAPAGFRFNPDDLVISDIQNRWALVDTKNSHRVVAYFNQNRKSYAVEALLIMRQFGINEKYTIGNASFFLASGNIPEGIYPGEEVRSFDPQNISVWEQLPSANPGHDGHRTYELRNGNERLWNFGCYKNAPEAAFDFIREKGITKLCRAGSFVYWRK